MKTFTVINATEKSILLKYKSFKGGNSKEHEISFGKSETIVTDAPSATFNSFKTVENSSRTKANPVETQYFFFHGDLENGKKYTLRISEENPLELQFLDQKDQVKMVVRDLGRILKNLRNMALPLGFLVTVRGQVDYDRGREISNSRFRYFPGGVAFPRSANDVALCLRFCREHEIPFRIRSGGHQHEGMCSADNILMIRLSEMNTITYLNEDKNAAWIPVGKKLENVYYELELSKRYIPGGGCQSVNVGGLTQGGGWGAGTRKFGMTCDNILAAEVVLADGSIVVADKDHHPRLFWALRGGGGGNFGVVTRFLFKLRTLSSNISTKMERLPRRDAEKVIKAWMKIMSSTKTSNDLIITLFLSANYKKRRGDSDKIRVFFRYFGTRKGLEKQIKEFFLEVYGNNKGKTALLEVDFSNIVSFDFADTSDAKIPPLTLQEHDKLTFEDIYQGAPPEHIRLKKLLSSVAENVPAPPRMTCDAPHPHKISSAFQQKGSDKENDALLAKKIVEYADQEQSFAGANAYITLHALGGASAIEPPEGRAYYFGDRGYLLQFQAWWSDPNDKRQKEYINWVTDFRKSVHKHVDGAFINFVDYDLVPNPHTPKGRIDLLRFYYGENLKELQHVKHDYDPDNFFAFKMSIPGKARKQK